MQAIRRILVAVKDTGARSHPAAAKAIQLARSLGARVELFHAIDTPIYIDMVGLRGKGMKQLQSDWRQRSLRDLHRIAARLGDSRVKVTAAAEWDFPGYEAIVRRASVMGADLIVAERHLGRHVAPWLLHMTDWELLRLSPVPVLIVKSPRPYSRPAILAAVDPAHTFAKPGKLDDEILRLGNTFKNALRGSLHAMHAYLPVPVGLPPEIWTTGKNLTAEIEARTHARARAGFEKAVKPAGIPPARRHLVARHPVDAIPDVARATRSAIVVMGAISRSGLKRVFIGNTAERVLDQLACDLLVVKPQRFASGVSRKARGPRFAVLPPP